MKARRHFKEYIYYDDASGLMLDTSRIIGAADKKHRAKLCAALEKVEALEKGAEANPDEKRLVGHYWLRDPAAAPLPEYEKEIRAAIERIHAFAAQIHKEALFSRAFVIGVGGSSMGARFISKALAGAENKMKLYFLDNTDPSGMDIIFSAVRPFLAETLTIAVSKSGQTAETLNSLEEVMALYAENGAGFAENAIAVTAPGSPLEKYALNGGWREIFPIMDWVCGRNSVLSPAGLLPLSLQGIDIDGLLSGAFWGDMLCRRAPEENPAALMAEAWYNLTGGKGGQEMIIFPYKDKLELLVAYAQQLIMESLGKEYDLDGKRVCQGLTVYGGRGNTAQHSFMQQLFVGGGNFFVVFLEVLRGRDKLSPLLSGGNISGDYLEASLLGARQVFSQKGISSITITLPDLNPYTIGLLIALWERTVSIYAYMINVNAYNQPAVEICKTEALKIMALKNRLCLFFKENPRMFFTAEEIAVILNEDAETIFKCLQYLRANEDYGVKAAAGSDIFSRLYSYDV